MLIKAYFLFVCTIRQHELMLEMLVALYYSVIESKQYWQTRREGFWYFYEKTPWFWYQYVFQHKLGKHIDHPKVTRQKNLEVLNKLEAMALVHMGHTTNMLGRLTKVPSSPSAIPHIIDTIVATTTIMPITLIAMNDCCC